ncbi:hypothetical protein C8Q77DRAFT_1158365 [Trametes polyzona]|nr:hypothetical protein C8Q77DRAFT_1158365 [Trametes polyzona]
MPAAFLSSGLYTNAFVKTLNPNLESWLTAMEDVLACVPYVDSVDPMFEQFFGRHLEFSRNQDMARRFMQRYSARTRLEIKDQWWKWYHVTQTAAANFQAQVDTLKSSNTRPTTAQTEQMHDLLESLEENKAHLLKLDRQIRDHANLAQLIQTHGGFCPWGLRHHLGNVPQQSGRQASLFFVDARLKCNCCKAVGNHECMLSAGSVRCYHCTTVVKRVCHWGNIHLSGEVYMRDSGALFAHYNGQGFTLLNHTRQPQEWVECFKNIEAATKYLIHHAFEFRSMNLSRNLSEAERFKPTEWPPAAIAAFKAQGSGGQSFSLRREHITVAIPLWTTIELLRIADDEDRREYEAWAKYLPTGGHQKVEGSIPAGAGAFLGAGACQNQSRKETPR